MNYLDLFAGSSALSEGFRRCGFSPVAYIEKDGHACDTIKTRQAFYYLHTQDNLELYYQYISGNLSREQFFLQVPELITDIVINKEISDETIPFLFQRIASLLKRQKRKNIDLILGGPPCQAYSILGRHRESMIRDERNFLYVQYGKFLMKFKPKAFVFENVPGLLSAKNGKHFENIKKYFDKIGYTIHPETLDASDYGVLQSRKRVIIVGWRKEYDLAFPSIPKIEKKWVINDIFSDLIPLEPGQVEMNAKYVTKSNVYLKKFEIRNGLEYVTHNITRSHNANDLQIYKIAIDRWNNYRTRLMYTDLPTRLQSHRNVRAFLDRYKVVDGKGLSHTLVAHIAKDGHHYIHPSSDQCRSLSVREAARVQSFPDDFFFEGPRTSVFTQIGNAVPPLMAQAIAKSMKPLLCQVI